MHAGPMEAASKRVGNLIGQLLPLSRTAPAAPPHGHQLDESESSSSSAVVVDLGRMVLAPQECRSDVESGSALDCGSSSVPPGVVGSSRHAIAVESCRAGALHEQQGTGFAGFRLQGDDDVEQEGTTPASSSCGSRCVRRIHERRRLGGVVEPGACQSSTTREPEHGRLELVEDSTTGGGWTDLRCCDQHDDDDSSEAQRVDSTLSLLALEGLRALGGLKQQGLMGRSSSPQISEAPMSSRAAFKPHLPCAGVSSPPTSSSSSLAAVMSEPVDAAVGSEKCIFCEIVRGQAPAFKLYEDDLCVCILDINPLAHGHSLVIPKLHYQNLQTTPPRIAAAMCAAVPLISKALMEATNCDSFNLVVNSGAAAGQVVHHTHYHIIPRCDGDGLWHSETAPRRPFMGAKEAAGFVRHVRNRLAYL